MATIEGETKILENCKINESLISLHISLNHQNLMISLGID